MNTKKLVAMLLCLVFLFSLCACGAENKPEAAQPTASTAESAVTFDGGDGTPENPYRISTGEQMHELSQLANESYDSPYQEACYILTADVDLGGEANPWTPIGYGKAGSGFIFSGTFDGNGHTVSGLYLVYGEDDDPEGISFGLFGEVDGTVCNITLADSTVCVVGDSVGGIAGSVSGDGELLNCKVLSDVTVTGSNHVGGVAGWASGACLENCVNESSVTSTDSVSYVGGIAGMAFCDIANCVNKGNVDSADSAGGVAGFLCGNMTQCENQGQITAQADAGGIVGYLGQDAIGTAYSVLDVGVTSCANTGSVHAGELAAGIAANVSGTGVGTITVRGCENTGAVSGGEKAGGIIASYQGSSVNTVDIASCLNTGEVSCEGNAAGGILASISCRDSDTITLKECRNEAPVTTAGYAGGILGWYLGVLNKEGAQASLTFTACENAGKVSGGSLGVGGIAGLVNGDHEPELKVRMDKCINSGEVFASGAGARLGGIIGVFEPHCALAELYDCMNSGSLIPEEAEISADEEWFGFKVAAGGIIGYVGSNGSRVNPTDDCGVTGRYAVEYENCINQGQIVTHEDGQEYLIGDIVGCAAAPVTAK